jgi:DNA polymerase V
MQQTTLTFFLPGDPSPFALPLLGFRIAAGFPSPADDYLEGRIDPNELLIENPAATFIAQVSGDSMKDAGIHDRDYMG